MPHVETLVVTVVRLGSAFAFLLLIIGISGFLVPEAIIGGKRFLRDVAVGSLIVIGALVVSVIVTLAVRGAAVEAVLLGAGVVFGATLGWLLTFPAIVPPPAPPNRLYRIVQSNHSDERWQEGKLIWFRSPSDHEHPDTLSVELFNAPTSTSPTESNMTFTITLKLVQSECRNCPDGIPVIFDDQTVTA